MCRFNYINTSTVVVVIALVRMRVVTVMIDISVKKKIKSFWRKSSGSNEKEFKLRKALMP